MPSRACLEEIRFAVGHLRIAYVLEYMEGAGLLAPLEPSW